MVIADDDAFALSVVNCGGTLKNREKNKDFIVPFFFSLCCKKIFHFI